MQIRYQVTNIRPEPTDKHKDARRVHLTACAPDNGVATVLVTDPAVLPGLKLGDILPAEFGAVEPPAQAAPASAAHEEPDRS